MDDVNDLARVVSSGLSPLVMEDVADEVRVRCPVFHAGVSQTFREQLPGVLKRYQRRTPCLSAQVGAVVRELLGLNPCDITSSTSVTGSTRLAA